MKVTLDMPKQEPKRYKDLEVGDVILGMGEQVLIYKGIIERNDLMYYDFMTLSDYGIGDVQAYVASYSDDPVQLVEIEVIVRPK